MTMTNQVKQYVQSIIEPLEATIAISTTESDAINLQGTTIAGMYIPAAFTGTSISFKASYDGVNFVDISDGSTIVAATIAPSQYVALSPIIFYGVRLLKIVSNASEAAERVITVIPYSI